MTLVVIGASPAVAAAAATLPVDLVHVRMPGAPVLGAGVLGAEVLGAEVLGARLRGEYAVDYQHAPAFLPFVDEVLRPLAPGAVVSLTELGLEPAAVAARRLGAAGVPVEVVRATRDKREMRRVLARKAPHLNPAFAPGDAGTEAVAALFAGGARVVAKPVAGTGSHAVALLRTPADLPADRRNGATLLERYVEGREFSVEALSSGGRHTVLGVAEKRTTGDGFVEVAHIMPAPSLTAAERRDVERAVGELLDAVGLVDGPSHTEVKVGADGRVTVIETHNRPGGDGIADLVHLTTGVDWRRAALGWAVRVPPRTGDVTPVAAAATVFFTAPPGRVGAVAGPPRELGAGGAGGARGAGAGGARGAGGVRIVEWDVQVEPGDPVYALRSSADRLGMAVLAAEGDAGAAVCASAVDELMAYQVVVTTQEEDQP
ncbi:ATP-grasp domain-containing protein [Streptomyces sp. TRM64462]|uniref:ATP-grasp domain-containing protein n=1 Tax=Streptomyces sp. TRM64462 TaxID=2741726 RepID=UPI002816883A|nr:ATP-grasp domain-containing protein [Streptomyces sp. TRM64462]